MTALLKSECERLLAVAVIVTGLILCIPVQAKPPHAKPTINDCGSNPGDTNFDWQKCEGVFIQKDKAALHKAEDDLLAVMPKASQSDFREEQTAWAAYAAKACQFYFNGDWGRDGQVVHGPHCIDGEIVERTRELRSLKAFLTHYEQAP